MTLRHFAIHGARRSLTVALRQFCSLSGLGHLASLLEVASRSWGGATRPGRADVQPEVIGSTSPAGRAGRERRATPRPLMGVRVAMLAVAVETDPVTALLDNGHLRTY